MTRTLGAVAALSLVAGAVQEDGIVRRAASEVASAADDVWDEKWDWAWYRKDTPEPHVRAEPPRSPETFTMDDGTVLPNILAQRGAEVGPAFADIADHFLATDDEDALYGFAPDAAPTLARIRELHGAVGIEPAVADPSWTSVTTRSENDHSLHDEDIVVTDFQSEDYLLETSVGNQPVSIFFSVADDGISTQAGGIIIRPPTG